MAKTKAPNPNQGSFFEAQISTPMYGDGSVRYAGERVLGETEVFNPADKHHKKNEPVDLPPAQETQWKTNLLERNQRLQEILGDLGYVAKTAQAWRAVDGAGSVVDRNAYDSLMRRPRMTHDMAAGMSRGHEATSEKFTKKFSDLWGMPPIKMAYERKDKDVMHDPSLAFGEVVRDAETNEIVGRTKVTPFMAMYQDRENFANRFSQSVITTRTMYREVSVAEAAKNRTKFMRGLKRQEKFLRPLQDLENERQQRAARLGVDRPKYFDGQAN